MEDRTKQNIDTWLSGSYDADSKAVIRQMMENDKAALEDAFYCDLEFGTGGLRGIMGVGTNRMNKYTVAMATQGLANYLKEQFPNQQVKIAIAYDCRNNSRYFSTVAAEVMSANGIFTYLFDDIRPTPELSFAIRHLGCQSGIVVTASHNPKEYNGYKAYWNDGGQLVPPHDKNVIEHVRKIKSIDEVKFTRNDNFIQLIGKEIDTIYINKLKTLSLHPELIEKHNQLRIVYSPLHGTGRDLVPTALREFGFKNVQVVEKQSIADGNFPTVVSPNPEESEALSMAIAQAKQTDADLVIATDPDADRVGIAIKDHNGEFILSNGNMTVSLIVYYVLKQWQQLGKLNGNQYIVKTIVTTELLKDIANQYDVECFDVLTGFKYIAEKIKEWDGKKQFLCGGEESYGYSVGDFVRDKDAVVSSCIIAEIAAWAEEQGKSLYDILTDIYMEFGYYKESLLSITKKGINGILEIKQMMENYRNNPPQTIDGQKIIRIKDYKTLTNRDILTGKTEKILLPVSDVLQFYLEDGSKITMRPSGTEPKIKYYFSVKADLKDKNSFAETTKLLEEKIKRFEMGV
jgi:phosphoglucomutase